MDLAKDDMPLNIRQQINKQTIKQTNKLSGINDTLEL